MIFSFWIQHALLLLRRKQFYNILLIQNKKWKYHLPIPTRVVQTVAIFSRITWLRDKTMKSTKIITTSAILARESYMLIQPLQKLQRRSKGARVATQRPCCLRNAAWLQKAYRCCGLVQIAQTQYRLANLSATKNIEGCKVPRSEWKYPP